MGNLAILKMACFRTELLILDEALRVHKFKFNLRNDKLKHSQELKLVEEVQMIIESKAELISNIHLC
jgi:hypothetical protein